MCLLTDNRFFPIRMGRMALMALLFSVLVAAAATANDPVEIWSKGSGFKLGAMTQAADLDMDGRMEIILVDVSNRVLVYDVEKGSVIWQAQLGEEYYLLDPLVGHFTGNGKMNVIIPCTSGDLFIFDGSTGAKVGTGHAKLDHKLSLPLTAYPMTRENEGTPYREGIVCFSPPPADRLVFVSIDSLAMLEEIGVYDVRGELLASPAVGVMGLDAPGPHVACVTRGGEVHAVAINSRGHQSRYQLPTRDRACRRGLTLGDINNDGKDEVVVADEGGFLYALGAVNGQLEPVWRDASEQRRNIAPEPVFPPVLVDVNRDGAQDILIPHQQEFQLRNGMTGLSLWGDPKSAYIEIYSNDYPFYSPPAIMRDDTGATYAVFCDQQRIKMLELATRKIVGQFVTNGQCKATPLVAGMLDNDKAQAFILNDAKGTVWLLDLGLNWPAFAIPWRGCNSGAWRSNSENREYQQFKIEQHQRLNKRLDGWLEEAKKNAEDKDWKAALAAVREARAINPRHYEARTLYRKYFFRQHLFGIIFATLAALAALGLLSWQAYRYLSRKIVEKLARRAIDQKRDDQAITLLKGLCGKFPKHGKYFKMLSGLYIRNKRFDAESAEIFDRAYAFFPDEVRILKALATAFSAVPRFDDHAAMIYQQMVQSVDKPGPWCFVLGRAYHHSGHFEDALEAYRAAIIHKFEDPGLSRYMADLYVRLRVTAAEILPTLDQVAGENLENANFLSVYCAACLSGRRYDEPAQKMAEALLKLDENAAEAHAILATHLLQAGYNKQAMKHSQRILQQNPNDSLGLRLLGACYAAERRLDETAMQIFARALMSNPDAPDILLAVSHGYIQDDRIDSEAREVFQRALVHTPNDETILSQLARIASIEKDDELTIRSLEPLLTLGRHSREYILQLANAYCRLGIQEDKAEPVYREALLHQPDHATIQDNLAAIYMRHARTDQEAAVLYEQVLARNPERFDIGMQLMRSYLDTELAERALELGQRITPLEPENPDLQKLMAVASEKSDQMEAAIGRYEHLLEGNPDDQETLCALSNLYGRKRRADNTAIGAFNRAIQIEPKKPEHYFHAARAYAQRENWDYVIQTLKNLLTQIPERLGATIDLMSELIEVAPKEMRLRWYLVDTLILDNRLTDARKHLLEILRLDAHQGEGVLMGLEKILEKNPKDALSYLEKGRICFALNRQQEARHALEQAHRHHPDNDEIKRNLMGLYQKILDKRDSTELRFKLGRLAMGLDKYDLAISCFQATAKDYRWEGESIRNLARCFMAKGMLDLAMQEVKRLQFEDDVKELVYDLGQRYEMVNDIGGAREAYKLIFAADINYRDVKGKLERLDANAGDAMSAERTAIINSLSEAAKNRYDMIEELGRGAMGIVYKARDNELEEVVALKILPDNLVRNPEALRRFRQEARSARRLSHPNIVRIHDIGEERGRKYISMEFVKGSDLKLKLRRNQRKPLPFEQALRHSTEIAEAMAYAHSISIVHRDIKPANLMLTEEDRIKVTDFGIAKIMEQTGGATDATMAGAIIGTPLYMSPEQVQGREVDHRADIYSMGVVFYEMANGRPPFTEGDLAYQHLHVEPKPLKDVPAPFADLVMKCLAKSPDDRFQNVDEVIAKLGEIKA